MMKSVLHVLLLACLVVHSHGEEYEDVESGRVSRAQCTSFTAESSLDNSTEAVLDSLGIFYVSQKSYMFYDYSGGDENSYATNMMVDLEEWSASMAAVKGFEAPNCTLIEDGEALFSALFKENEEESSYAPALYEGPICGMRGDKFKVEVGVFLDDNCTVLAPKLMYSYRKKAARGQIDSSIASIVGVVAKESKMTIGCKRYPICGELLGESVSTQFCNQNSDSSNAWYSEFNMTQKNEYGKDSYQLSQNDLYNMGSACYAAVTSMNQGLTLESYLDDHGQLKGKGSKVKVFVIIGLVSVALLLIVRSVRIHRKRKKKQQQAKKLEEEPDSDSSQASGTFASMEDGDETSEGSGTFGQSTFATNMTGESGTYATMMTGEYTCATNMTDESTLASTMQGQLWQDWKKAKKELKQELWPNEDQGQEIQRISTPKTGKLKKKKRWRISLSRLRTPDDAKLPLVTEDDKGVVNFNKAPEAPEADQGADTLAGDNDEDQTKAFWRPSLKTGTHRGSQNKA